MKHLNDLSCMISDFKNRSFRSSPTVTGILYDPIDDDIDNIPESEREKEDYTDKSCKGKMLRICKFDSSYDHERRKVYHIIQTHLMD